MANISNKTHYTPPKSTFLSVLYFIECLHLSSCSWQKPRAYPWHFFHSITQTYNQLLNCVGFASKNFAILLPYLYTHWLLSLLLSWEISDEMCFLFTCSTKFIIEQQMLNHFCILLRNQGTVLNILLKHSHLVRCCEDYRPYTLDKETKTEVKLFVQLVQMGSVPVSIWIKTDRLHNLCP